MSIFGSISDPAATFLLTGARVVDPSAGEDRVRDLAVVDGLLADPAALPADAPRIDASGFVATPGLCDLHTHLREPGLERAETIASGTRAAARGGFTTVCAMPNTDPPPDDSESVRWILDRAGGAASRVRVVAAATQGRGGEQPTNVVELAASGIVGVSDDGAAIGSGAVARELLAGLASLGLPLIEHAEDARTAQGSVMRAGPTATRLGLAGWPESAELSMVERDIALAEETGAWVHFTHLSTAGALEAIRRAKRRGIRVTCDVTPHHLALTDDWVAGWRGFAWEEPGGVAADPFGAPLDAALAYDPACRVNPPLASRGDAMALLAGVADGTIDAIATDHAPHPRERKGVEFGAAAPGMIGLETALSLGLAAVESGSLELVRLIEALSTKPASLIGETRSLAAGSVADLVVFDAGARWRLGASGLASTSSNTPLLGMELPGVVRMTVAGGRITYRDGLDARRLSPGCGTMRTAHPAASDGCRSARTRNSIRMRDQASGASSGRRSCSPASSSSSLSACSASTGRSGCWWCFSSSTWSCSSSSA
ncbi:MAG: dihydroorotase [Chloroflexota bacterium]